MVFLLKVRYRRAVPPMALNGSRESVGTFIHQMNGQAWAERGRGKKGSDAIDVLNFLSRKKTPCTFLLENALEHAN